VPVELVVENRFGALYGKPQAAAVPQTSRQAPEFPARFLL
jgi:hypothetical protein